MTNMLVFANGTAYRFSWFILSLLNQNGFRGCGLKWCKEERFQQQLNFVGCQDNDPEKPKLSVTVN